MGSNVNIERGPFGKVLVTRHLSPRQKQPIFEFNLQKHGNEADIQPPKSPKESCSNEWSHVALFEFAQNLFIIDGDNWKLFAKEVGMTQQEIRNISWKDAGKASDPFKMVVEHYKGRGGTPEEFVDAMYKCHRSLKVNGSFSPESKKSKSSTGSSGRGSLSSNNVNFDTYGSHDSDTSGTQSRDSGLPHGRKRSHPSTSNNNTTPKASGSGIVSGSMRSSHKTSKRPRFAKPKSAPSQLSFISDADADADLSESDTSDDNAHVPGPSSCLSLDESRLCRNDKTKLENMFLWDISFYLNISNWRALGRSLGLDETVLIDVDNGFKSTSFRECSYQMLLQWRQKFPSKCTYGTLYCALMKEGMNDVAKQMATITRNNAS
ncbi:hypothetical protein Ocin01_03827 [Orchesella cincta]|uniref:Death domain-containing protein n=1 Tax=Orchesella cincta TaxID=48709 RepID=A0A1D2NC52_ORCCI|nr:hypothetical protein Ocin01_03827 [Orchesella cincta]